MAEQYRSAFTEENLISTGDTTTIANTYVVLGEYKVQAGEMITVGFGNHTGQDNSEGRIYADLKNAANTEVNGMLRLNAVDPQDRHLQTLFEFRTETLRQSSTDRSKQIPYAEIKKALTEDRKLQLTFRADSAGDVSQANSKLLMDITRYAVK